MNETARVAPDCPPGELRLQWRPADEFPAPGQIVLISASWNGLNLRQRYFQGRCAGHGGNRRWVGVVYPRGGSPEEVELGVTHWAEWPGSEA